MDKVKLYLKRLGFPDDVKIEHTYNFLKEIQYRQVTTIPYENVDIINNIPLSLKIDDLFDKIVTKQRGGYCFEVNALLSFILKEMGFEVKDYFARFLRGEETIPMRRHRIMIVKCSEGEYLLDAGVGSQAPRYPLKLELDTIQNQFGESYKFEKDSLLGWVMCEKHQDEWRRVFSFNEDIQLDVDFEIPSFYCEKSPDSKFNKGLMISLKTDTGRKTVDKDTYKEFAGNEVTLIRENLSHDEMDKVLKEVFNIYTF